MGELDGRRVLLGVSGGIAAYKAAALARALVTAGARVDVVLTRGATRFVGAATFEGLTGRSAHVEVWDDVPGGTHVALGRDADAIVVYPATAHTLARLAAGLADDLLTSTVLAARAPLVLAPAMHTAMWEHPATVDNVARLRARGAVVVGPDDGPLMGGDEGPGRAVEPAVVLAEVARVLGRGRDLDGRRVVVTAGGTREPIDPVRYLGNRSSGRMGVALAEAAARRGAEVVLVAAGVTLPTPAGVRRVDVGTAEELRDAVLAEVDGADVVIKAAAVADFRPRTVSPGKIKRAEGVPTIVLEPTPDVVAAVLAARGERGLPLVVAFAAETEDVVANGRAKLAAKGVDLLVVNDVAAPGIGFGAADNAVVVLEPGGAETVVARAPKAVVADAILDRVATRLVG